VPENLPDADRLGRQTAWTLNGYSSGSGPVPLPQHEGKRFYVLLGPWKVQERIIASATMDMRTGELDFLIRPVEDSDGPRTWENRRFIAAMRWGRAKRIVRERARRMFRKDDNA
jgi:hypothetical protein